MMSCFRLGIPARFLLICCFSLYAAQASCAGIDEARARQNYMLNCQGCHLPDGAGYPGKVPRLKGFLGNFLHVPGGRAFIVQVPGAANSPLSDARLAEVLNWVLEHFSPEQVPADFKPYTGAEVTQLRKHVMVDVQKRRATLITEIQQKLGVETDAAGS